MLMCELKQGQSGVIERLDLHRNFAVRLRDMGFCEGERVVSVKKGLMPSPILYRVKGSEIAVRSTDAAKIEVSV